MEHYPSITRGKSVRSVLSVPREVKAGYVEHQSVPLAWSTSWGPKKQADPHEVYRAGKQARSGAAARLHDASARQYERQNNG